MYIFRNAVKNIGRNKSRNILIAVIIFVIILATSVSIIINTTSKEIIDVYKTQFGSELYINLDYEKLKKDRTGFEGITVDQYIAFGESDLLKSKEYKAFVYVGSDGWIAIDENSGNDIINSGNSEDYLPLKAKVEGSTRSDINDDFKSGVRKIVHGKMYENIDECIVSEEFAELNNLSVGDKIKITSNLKKNPMTHELTISGIFEDNTEVVNNHQNLSTYENGSNDIFASFETVINLQLYDSAGSLDAEYVLKDPAFLENYKAELKEKGLSDFYIVSTDEASYNKIVKPVQGIAKIINVFLIVVLILGSVILVLLSTLAIRERKYEIGVLRAMGMKKRKVALGLLSEMLIITGICLIAGLGIGTSISQPVADIMIKNQIETVNDSNDNTNGISIINESESGGAEPLNELKISLNIEAVSQIIVVSLLLAVISSLTGILYITKFEPMKILSERN
ncbi:MAG: FtsX-like permease family protein [Candidatus Izemoplasmatales bacterium]|jgi:putative ABC transport system permease protein